MIYRCPADKYEPLSAFIVPHADRVIKPPIYLRPTLATDTLYTAVFSKERSNTNMNTLFQNLNMKDKNCAYKFKFKKISNIHSFSAYFIFQSLLCFFKKWIFINMCKSNTQKRTKRKKTKWILCFLLIYNYLIHYVLLSLLIYFCFSRFKYICTEFYIHVFT